MDDWTTTLTFRYLGETEDLVGGRADGSCDVTASGFVHDVDSYLEFGLRGTYSFTENSELAVGFINITDEEPPFSLTAAGEWPWFDQSLYDPRGTRFYMNFTHNFF